MVVLLQRLPPQEVGPPRPAAAHLCGTPAALQRERHGGPATVGPGIIEA